MKDYIFKKIIMNQVYFIFNLVILDYILSKLEGLKMVIKIFFLKIFLKLLNQIITIIIMIVSYFMGVKYVYLTYVCNVYQDII